MTPEELAVWYRDEYHAGVYTHTLEQDRGVAELRLRAYGPKIQGRVLDVGSGNGAFVEAARAAGIKTAYGQDLSQGNTGYTYRRELAAVNFPMGHFQAVTVHDVLEHVPDPRAMLQEIHRLLDPEGWLILEYPDFDFERHWKPIEHLWLLSAPQVAALLDRAGFRIAYYTTPVEGKTTFYCRPTRRVHKSVLVPPGIGDSYWSLVKLPGFLRSIGEDYADVWVSDPDNRQRSLEWLRKVPWARACGYRRHKVTAPEFHEAYMQKGRFLFQNVQGCDFFLAFNGQMRYGSDLDLLEPSWGAEWFPPLFEPLEEKQYRGRFEQQYGRYVVAYFVPHGMYRGWLKQLAPSAIEVYLKIVKAAGYEVVFMGAEWDRNGLPGQLARAVGGVDLCGQTSIDEMFALIKGSAGVMGWPAGNTIMATVLRRPTLMWWNKYFDSRFWELSCPPESRNRWYHWYDTANANRSQVEAFLERIKDGTGS